MPRTQARLASLIAVMTLCACTTGKLPVGAKGGTRPAGPASVGPGSIPAASPRAAGGERPPVTAGAGLIGNNAGNLIGNNAGNLIGKVKVPAGLLSDAGAGVISDKGGGVVANGGARYAVAQADRFGQVPAAGLRVTARDAAGTPALDADGKPIEAVTAPDGTFELRDLPPGGALVIAAALPGGRGEVLALAPRGRAAGEPLEADLVSTLTTGFIIDEYVRPQAQPRQVIERLPASIEAETRRLAAEALASSRLPAPPALDLARIREAIVAMRAATPAFDAQLEAVRKLLVAAGLSDLGAGQLATQVHFGSINALLPAADGSLLIHAAADRRIWRMRADGRLEVVVGAGASAQSDEIDGRAGASVTLGPIPAKTFDGLGRLVLAVGGPVRNALVRVEADGTLRVLGNVPGRVKCLFATGEARFLALTGPRAASADAPGEPAKAWELAAGQAARELHAFDEATGALIGQITSAGADASGRHLLQTSRKIAVDRVTVILRLDPTTFATEELMATPVGDKKTLWVDPAGNLFEADDLARRLSLLPADGPPRVLTSALPKYGKCTQPVLAPDGSVYYRQYARVFRVADGKVTAVAGLAGARVGAEVALSQPTGVAVGADGTLFVADALLDRVFAVAQDETSLVAIGGGKAAIADGASATEIGLQNPGALAADAAGNLFVVNQRQQDGHRVLKVEPTGIVRIAFKAPADRRVGQLATGPDGTLWLLVVGGDELRALYRIPPGGAAERVTEVPGGRMVLGVANGAPHLLTSAKLRKWVEGTGLVDVADGPGKTLTGDTHGMVIDERGRCYVLDSYRDQVWRWDPATAKVEVVAGKGGVVLNGTGVDDGLANPRYITWDGVGELFVTDGGHKQVKRIPLADLDRDAAATL